MEVAAGGLGGDGAGLGGGVGVEEGVLGGGGQVVQGLAEQVAVGFQVGQATVQEAQLVGQGQHLAAARACRRGAGGGVASARRAAHPRAARLSHPGPQSVADRSSLRTSTQTLRPRRLTVATTSQDPRFSLTTSTLRPTSPPFARVAGTRSGRIAAPTPQAPRIARRAALAIAPGDEPGSCSQWLLALDRDARAAEAVLGRDDVPGRLICRPRAGTSLLDSASHPLHILRADSGVPGVEARERAVLVLGQGIGHWQ